MTALDPACPENAAEAPSPKWTSERVAFITEQYLVYRKSGDEIARMLGPAFTRNSVTGKLFRTGALKARSGMGLGSDHGLPKAPISATQVRVPKDARGGQSSREGGSSKAEPGGRISSRRPRLSSRLTASHSSTPRKASAAGRKSVDGAAHVCGAPKVLGAYCETHAAVAYRSVSPPAPEIQIPNQKTGPARGRSGAAFGEAS